MSGAKESQPLRKGSSRFRPRARLVQEIGEDLISNQIIALVELIKNSYDADAQRVEITFRPSAEDNGGSILVEDDGHGIPLEVLQNSWMEPATKSKKDRRFSPNGRRMTGEKGLGRFAAARIAKQMHLESVAGSPRRRVVADFDWEKFKDEALYLDQVRCKWEEYSVSRSTPTGTRLELRGLRDHWDLSAFQRLRAELARLTVRPSDEDPFEIELALPAEFEEYGGKVTPPPVLDRPHYAIKGEMSADGQLKARLKIRGRETFISTQVRLKGGRLPECGPFLFDVKVWDLDDLESLAVDLGSTKKNLRNDLREAAGVSIYRDHFRVLPYGGPANDWLRLDLRRVQSPTLRLSNNQVVGAVYITADANPELRDQTNREGIVESQAFDDLRSCVIEAFARIEVARYEIRRRRGKTEKSKGLFEDLDIAPVRAAFAEKYPNDNEFIRYLEDRERQIRSTVDQIQDVLARYRRLATLGQLIDVILHDGRTPVAAIKNQCDLGQRSLNKMSIPPDARKEFVGRLESISKQAEALGGLFRRLSPFGGRKRGRPVENAIEDLISGTFEIFHHDLAELGVVLSLPESRTIVKVDPAEMQQVFTNMLANSLYWLSKVPKDKREIVVRVKRLNEGLEIWFCDSGPGVPEEARDFIFEPYFSTKPDGIGLGLTIAGEIVSEYAGLLELVEPILLPGANFRIFLRTRIE